MSKERMTADGKGLPLHLVGKVLRVSVFLALVPTWTRALAAEPEGAANPELLLEGIRNRTAAHLSQLHDYTCHVVVDRSIQAMRTGSFNQRAREEFDVAFLGGRELFLRPGESRFEEQSINRVVPLGMIGNDILGSHDDVLFSSDAATFTYAGKCKKDGYKTFQYNFRVPQASSRLLVSLSNFGNAMVGYQGSFWVNSETLDMVRLEWKTNRIPSSVGISSVRKSMRYKVVQIGNSEFLLPTDSELTSFDKMGHYRRNVISLEHCLKFTGESVVTFGKPAADHHRDAERLQP